MTTTTGSTSSKDALKAAYLTIRKLQREVDDAKETSFTPIAVVGIGCRFPGGAEGSEAYWEILHEGRDVVTEVPAERFDVERYYDPEQGTPGKTRTRWGGFLDDIDTFDHAFFGISHREAELMDPQQRIALETAWMALEDAGIPAENLAGTRTGVYLGVSSSDYATAGSHVPEDICAYSSSGTAHSAVAGRISYVLDLQGPAMAIDTACSSSLVAIHQACQALRAGECDVALSGGVNVVMSPLPSIAFSSFGMMSGDGRARTFDEKGDGCVRGEGAGIVVLKRLSDARRDGDEVLAVIAGSAVNQDGRSSGFTAPNVESQADCIRSALRAARVDPGDVQFIECHGTGTPLGDPIEVQALSHVYGDTAERCLLGSAKSTISHLEAAAGAASFIKAVLALTKGVIPPNLHFDRLNPHISFERTSFAVPTRPEAWPSARAGRHAAVSAFGFSGTNAHVVLSEAPSVEPAEPVTATEGGEKLLVLSARSRTALDNLAREYEDLLLQEGTQWSSTVQAAATRRSHLQHRLAVMAPDTATAADALEGWREGWPGTRIWTDTAKDSPVVFVYSGQGAEYPGMGRELYDAEPVFQRAVDTCAEILRPHLPRPLLDVVWPQEGEEASAVHRLTYAQPALFTFEYALSRLWESWGIRPDLVLGHSIGELCAATCAGVYDVEEMLPFVALRGALLDSVENAGMGAIGAAVAEVESALEGRNDVVIGAINSPRSVTVSGERGAVAQMCETFAARGYRTKLLPVTTASHSPLVDPLVPELVAAAGHLQARVPRVPVISNVTGTAWDWRVPVTPEYWGEHLRSTVQFEQGVRTVHDLGFTTFLEVGPAPRLSSAVEETLEGERITLLPSLRRGQPDRATMVSSAARLYVGGASLAWNEAGDRPRPARVPLPRYPFDPTPCPVVTATEVPTVMQVARRDDTGRLGYELEWQVLTGEGVPTRGTWIVTGPPDLARDVVEALDNGAFAAAPDEVVDLIALRGASTVLWLLDPAGTPQDAAEAQRQIAQRVARAVELVTSLMAPGVPVRIWFVTTGGVLLDGDDEERIAPAHAALWGFARSMEQEAHSLWGGILDTDPTRAVTEQLAVAVRTGIFNRGETQVAIRDGVVHVPRLVRCDSKVASWKVEADGTYLVTGGFGGLGAATAEWLVEQGARHLVLASRRPLPARDTWRAVEDLADADGADRISLVRRLEAAGAEVRVASLDVTDRVALAAWVSQNEAECRPRLRGVIHAAGVGGFLPIGDVTDRAVEDHLDAKVAGTWNVLDVLGDRLDFVVLYSSQAAVLSAPYTSLYATANAGMDALADVWAARGVPVTSVNWGLWDGVGLARDRDASTVGKGMTPLEPERALAALRRVLAERRRHAVVVDAEWQDWGTAYRRATDSSILDSLLHDRARATRESLPTPEELFALPTERREAFLSERILTAVTETLGGSAVLDTDSSLFDAGMDSLMAVDLKNRLEKRLNVRVSVATFLSGAAVIDIASEIVASLSTGESQLQEIERIDRNDDAAARIIAKFAAARSVS